MLCDEFCSHDTHPFLYKLNLEEKNYIRDICHSIVYLKKEHNLDFSKEGILSPLIEALNNHFKKFPDKEYFFRLNKLSPKDARYFIEKCDDEDEILTIETIKQDLDYLHVGIPVNKTAEHCINVLVHSDRIFCEFSFSDDKEEFSLLLLDFQNVNYKTETRCYVKDSTLIAISQYYTDLFGVYDNSDNVLKLVKNFIIEKKITNLESYVFDIYFDSTENVKLIEINPFDHGTDSCLFEWSELDVMSPDSKICIFKFKDINDSIVTIQE